MNTDRITSIGDVENFLQGTDKVDFAFASKAEKYQFILQTLVQLSYRLVRKKEKILIKRYLKKVTGLSKKQIKRLVKKWKEGKLLASLTQPNRHKFATVYGPTEVALLARADEALNFPNGYAVKKSLEREFSVFKKAKFQIIAGISVSHIYNIRKGNLQYISKVKHYVKTNPVATPIGERRKPQPFGKPGFLRVDSVHQGDLDKTKGVYHINIVDEVTQWELVGCVEGISEAFLLPLLEKLLNEIPFQILNFHSDNGTEYINCQVAEMLNQLVVKQTKSRSRKSTDNALVEGKNGSVIRKHMGRNHIPKKFAELVNVFYQKYFNPFLNYHRICSFATDYVDKRGKIRKKYDLHLTPYDRLKSLENPAQYLKTGITFEELDKIAYAKSDIEAGEEMKVEKEQVFSEIKIR